MIEQRERLTRAESEGWLALVEALDRVPPGELERPGAQPDGWSVKDLLWHLRCWTQEAAHQLAEVRRGRYEPQGWETDALNAAFLAEGREVDAATARAELERSRARVLAEWAGVTELSGPVVEWFGESGPEHYHEHLPALEEFARRLGAQGRPGAPERRRAKLAAEETVWRDLEAVVAAIPDERLEQPGVTPDGWTVKDTLWHVARWCEDFVDVADRSPDASFEGAADRTDEEIEALNRAWAEESRFTPIQQVRSSWMRAREAMVDRFGSMADPSPAAEDWFDACGAVHYEMHLIDLRPWAGLDDG